VHDLVPAAKTKHLLDVGGFAADDPRASLSEYAQIPLATSSRRVR